MYRCKRFVWFCLERKRAYVSDILYGHHIARLEGKGKNPEHLIAFAVRVPYLIQNQRMYNVLERTTGERPFGRKQEYTFLKIPSYTSRCKKPSTYLNVTEMNIVIILYDIS